MNKVETTSSKMINKTDSSGRATFWHDIKALIKVGIINSNVMTAFAGFWLALYFTNTSFSAHWDTFFITMAGTALVIAGACVLNNYYDRDIDPLMARTKTRATVTGSIPLSFILVLGIALSISGIILLLLTTVQAAIFGAIGWFAYFVLYTVWSKRRYTINTAIGSLSGAVPPLIGWAAVDPNLHIVAIIMFLTIFIWQTPHFLALAMKKCDDYKAAGIPMLPVVHGFPITKRQMVVYITCLLPLPFLLFSLGNVFIIIATILNVGWLTIGIKGFFVKDDLKWANIMFIYSLFYLTVYFLTMIIVTIPSVVS
ncbi:heme o synthase [Aquibacillus koreensis]|uniref:Protoheme IX farnesyltransferase n=1 Tax=Aquibacillus koreensis TaxID=279446 RepID=A0A9X3WNT2_9BACI|nr:heme o synthase [Aquibacillus koreensis]MCT2538096.1 heme o synthase [Aquibacillus koreensis]MDC3420619.1 heme o synthase [Aquibacillus koreensis]